MPCRSQAWSKAWTRQRRGSPRAAQRASTAASASGSSSTGRVSVNRVELAGLGADLGDVEVEVADRVGLEALLARSLALGAGQAGDAVALQAAVQAGARQRRDRGLERVEAVVERQQRVPTEGDDHGL